MNRSGCLRSNVFIADSLTDAGLQGIAEKSVNKRPQQNELTDGKAGNRDYLEARYRRIQHPSWNLRATAWMLANQGVMDTIVFLVSNHKDGLPGQRMKRVRYHCFKCQKTGIMFPARMAGQSLGLP